MLEPETPPAAGKRPRRNSRRDQGHTQCGRSTQRRPWIAPTRDTGPSALVCTEDRRKWGCSDCRHRRCHTGRRARHLQRRRCPDRLRRARCLLRPCRTSRARCRWRDRTQRARRSLHRPRRDWRCMSNPDTSRRRWPAPHASSRRSHREVSTACLGPSCQLDYPARSTVSGPRPTASKEPKGRARSRLFLPRDVDPPREE